MKCLICDNQGINDWWLSQADFRYFYGESLPRFDLANCFCSSCYNDLPNHRLNAYLFEYWKGLQQTQTELQQDHDLTEKSKKHYYKWHPASECVKVSQHFSSSLGQAIQYIWRSETLNPNAVTKGQSIDEIVKDLEKAQAFIQFEIDRLRGN